MIRTVLSKARPVHLVMASAFLVGFLVSGYKFLDAREVTLILARLNWLMAIPLLLLPAAYLALKSVRFVDLFELTDQPAVEPEVRRLTAVSYASAQLATLLPGGYVARIGLMESALKRGAKAVIPTLAEKVLDIALLLLVGLYACCYFPRLEYLAGGLSVFLVVFVLLASSRTVRSGLKESTISLVSRFGGERLIRKALESRVPSAGALAKLALQTVAVLLSEIAILWASFAVLDLTATPLVLILSYAIADILGRVAPTPGGFGLTEVGMVAFLHSVDGMNLNEAAAATFLFRFLLFIVPVIYGGLCYLFLWSPLTARLATAPSDRSIQDS